MEIKIKTQFECNQHIFAVRYHSRNDFRVFSAVVSAVTLKDTGSGFAENYIIHDCGAYQTLGSDLFAFATLDEALAYIKEHMEQE